MTTPWVAHMLAGAGPGEPAPARWFEVWGEPAPRHAGSLLKPGDGRAPGSPAIRSLHVHDDRNVLVGFGDWDSNDGSTALTTFDPVTGQSATHGVYPTEAFETFRTVGGLTYALYVDPIGYWEPTRPFATWPPQGQPPGMIDAIHIFDLVEQGGRLWVAGASHGGTGSGVATVWYSDDGGATWTRTTPSGVIGDWERAYRIGVGLDGRVCVLLGSNYWNKWGEWYTWDGSGWTPGADPGPDPHQPQTPPPGVLIPPDSVFARTSTHWVMGTSTGDIYVIPAD